MRIHHYPYNFGLSIYHEYGMTHLNVFMVWVTRTFPSRSPFATIVGIGKVSPGPFSVAAPCELKYHGLFGDTPISIRPETNSG